MQTVQDQVYDELITLSGGYTNMVEMVTDVIERSVAYVLDAEEDLDQLEGCEKSVFGIKFEKSFADAFGLPRKRKKATTALDTVIGGYDIDIKTTLGGNTWTIPKEAFDQWSLVLKVDYHKQSYRLGTILLSEDRLNKGKNRDSKVTISEAGRATISWIIPEAQFSQGAYKLSYTAV